MAPVEVLKAIAEAAERGEPFVVATVVSTGGSSPRKSGAKMLVRSDGSISGTIGGGAIEQQIVEAALALLRQGDAETRLVETHLTHDLGMCCGGKMGVFLEKFGGRERMYLFGAGHVAKPLAALAVQVGFDVTVIDDRAEWLTAERFPRARRLQSEPDDAAKSLPFDERTQVCITTHDHPLDQRVLEIVLRKPAAYIGMIGSRRKGERFKQRLAAAGYTPEEIQRFRTPMGVPIGAQGPEEIAVSVVAEMIAVRRREAVGAADEESGDAPVVASISR
jgi:xanthine dehydrogenase accessory factor